MFDTGDCYVNHLSRCLIKKQDAMAEILAQQNRRAGVAKSKKLSTRVDLTPMVDLGFLLLTFFIFTTTMSAPTTMKMVLPNDSADPTPIKESAALTILLGTANSVSYYEGKLMPGGANIKLSSLSKIRQVIINKKSETVPTDFVVVIKPATTSVYKNLVDIVDEMSINDVKRYALVDITPAEENYVSR